MDYAITSGEFLRFRKLIYDESGISLGDQKDTLLASELSKRDDLFRLSDAGAFSE